MMLRTLACGLVTVALWCPPDAARSQPAPGPAPNPAADRMPPGPEMARHRAALIAQCPPLPDISDADAAKLPIHVTRWGTDGPRVVLIHGGVQGRLGGGPDTYDKQQALGMDGWRVERVERPGFGQSPTRGPDDMEREAIWIADMLGDGAHLVGHSWGGADALLAAARRPEAVRSLVLIEPALIALVDADPALGGNPAARAGAVLRAKILMAAQTPADYGRTFAGALGAGTKAGEATNSGAITFDVDAAEATRVGCALLRGRMAPPDAFQRAIQAVDRAGIPVLAVTGGWSPDFDAVGEVVARLTHGRHVIVRSPGHFVQLLNAPDFNREVAAFMRDADSRRPAAQ